MSRQREVPLETQAAALFSFRGSFVLVLLGTLGYPPEHDVVRVTHGLSHGPKGIFFFFCSLVCVTPCLQAESFILFHSWNHASLSYFSVPSPSIPPFDSPGFPRSPYRILPPRLRHNHRSEHSSVRSGFSHVRVIVSRPRDIDKPTLHFFFLGRDRG